jgi:hypothetical protein
MAMQTALRLVVSCGEHHGSHVNMVVEAIIPTTEELSELPDTPAGEVADALDVVSETLKSPAKAHRARPATANSVSRSRRSSRAPSLPTDGLTQTTPEKQIVDVDTGMELLTVPF